MNDYIKLGGTLFVPVTHKDLDFIVSGIKYKGLKSVLVDTEDSIAEIDVQEALHSIEKMLQNFEKNEILVFIRPRNVAFLKEFMKFRNIDLVDGFILPKFSLENANSYLKIVQDTGHYIMPSIEGQELFDTTQLIKLREELLPFKDRIILIRFGLEDMLRQLKMRRKCEDSIFDFSVSSSVLGNFIAIFKSAGFEISGGVYPCFKDKEGFVSDVLRDLKEGLFSKTIIHPSQIDIVNELYKVTQEEFDEAQEICSFNGEIMSQAGKMAEIKTMTPYSEHIVKRANIYGIKTKTDV